MSGGTGLSSEKEFLWRGESVAPGRLGAHGGLNFTGMTLSLFMHRGLRGLIVGALATACGLFAADAGKGAAPATVDELRERLTAHVAQPRQGIQGKEGVLHACAFGAVLAGVNGSGCG